jgi:hypothetical protein
MSQIDFKNNRNNTSLYDIGTGTENAYEFSHNLPQLHKKLNGVGFGIKANAGL